MILNEVRVEQTIDRDERGHFHKALVVVKVPDRGGHVPLAMVRKRSLHEGATRAPGTRSRLSTREMPRVPDRPSPPRASS